MNPVVGDAALLEKYGTRTPEAVSEGEKIATHLEYALRSLEQAHEPHDKRLDLLLELESFIADGIFPQLEASFRSESEERAPCFIDSSGSACAVAYLMLSTGHSDLALRIAQKHRHSTIAEIAADATFSAEFTAWQEQSGLSLAELQLIQPTYTVSSPSSAAAAAATLHESWHIALQVQLPQRADSLSNRLRSRGCQHK
jgi:hypothetical protein